METTIQISIDSKLKESADSLFASLGLDTATALRMILVYTCETKDIPPAITEYAKKDCEDLEIIRQKRLALKGSMRGGIWMSDDFDAPLQEMEEYM
ncbi:MAG: type II toxin-antitoxin system RelB/DinJ family antitoxin [Clostridiales bacterium]|jgi:DNA-damage-inducible protein J|nr:type II toxin-antitoxin system RelB/DinJ family antitoxin [Clostridiales bacterium]